MRKWLWISGGMVFLIVGWIYYTFFTLSEPQTVALEAMQKAYSGEPDKMVQALEYVDFSAKPRLKQQLIADIMHRHRDFLAYEKQNKQMPMNKLKLKGEMFAILNNQDSDPEYSYQMIELEINQVHHPHLFRLHQVNGEWKLDVKSMQKLLSRVGVTKYEEKKPHSDDIGYGLGDAIETSSRYTVWIQMHVLFFHRFTS